MKSTMLKLALMALTVIAPMGAFAQSQVDANLGYYGTDLSGVYANAKSSASYGQTAQYSPSLNANVKYTFALKLDDANTIKFAGLYDAWLGLYTGSTANQTATSGQNAGLIQPSVQWTGYGFDVTTAFPMYYANPADSAGLNTLKYAYTVTGYLPVATTTYPVATYSFWVTNYTKAMYKYSFDKTFSVAAGLELDYGLTPTPWLADLKPQVTVVYSIAQLDTKFSFFSKYSDNVSSQYYDTFLEPKLTIDAKDLVPGLKAYLASKISLTTTNPAYTVAGTVQNFHNTSLTPGATYKLGMGSAGDLTFEVAGKFNKIDNDQSGTNNKKDVAPYAELQVKVGYSVKF